MSEIKIRVDENMTEESDKKKTHNSSKKELSEILDRLDKLESFVRSLKEIGGDFPRLLKETGIK